MGFAGAIFVMPRHVTDIIAAAIFIASALAATACGKFPLGFGGQPEVLPGERVQFADKRLAIIPAHLLHRMASTFEFTGVAAHHRLPQFLRDLGLADVVRRQRNAVDG